MKEKQLVFRRSHAEISLAVFERIILLVLDEDVHEPGHRALQTFQDYDPLPDFQQHPDVSKTGDAKLQLVQTLSYH